jgi:disulfide bond formation protein DsbB
LEARLPASQYREPGSAAGDTKVPPPRQVHVCIEGNRPLLFPLLDSHPRRVYAAVAVVCLALLGFGLYLQHGVGLEPCPMCIVQRYTMVLIAVVAALAALVPGRRLRLVLSLLLLLLATFGAFVAARQSWLQWYPPEVATCGRDFYGMIESFPLQRAIPMIFRGSGDCTAIDWTFLGGSIANWSFLWFLAFALLFLVQCWRGLRRPQPA